jgi:hypothetical protein
MCPVASAPGGSRGGQGLSMGGYVTGREATAGATPPGCANVSYARPLTVFLFE